jgi:hypothetical protein
MKKMNKFKAKAFAKFQITNPVDQINSKPQVYKSKTTQPSNVFLALVFEF